MAGQESFNTWFELALGLPDAIPADAELALNDTPAVQSESVPVEAAQSEAAAARRLAASFAQLRTESALVPAAGSLQQLLARAQAQLNLPPVADSLALPTAAEVSSEVKLPEPKLVDIYDWCTGQLSDAEAGAVERQLAVTPESQPLLRSTAKLAGALGWLRQATALQPSADVNKRFADRVAGYLDGQLQTAVEASSERPSFAVPSYIPGTLVTVASDAPARSAKKSSFARTASWAVAACLLVGLSLVTWSAWPRPQGQPVLAQVAAAGSWDELRALQPQLAQLVGESLLEPEAVSATELANLQLLWDLTTRGDQPDQLVTAKLLASQQVQRQSHSWSVARTGNVAWPWESVAYADDRGGAIEPQRNQALRQAMRAGDLAQVQKLVAGQTAPRYQLVQLWALLSVGDRPAAWQWAQHLAGAVPESAWPLTSQVYLAGAYRALDRPEESLARFERLEAMVPALGLQIGTLYRWDLHDDSRALVWFRRLEQCRDAGLVALAAAEIAQIRLETPLVDEFARLDWDRVQADPAVPVGVKIWNQSEGRTLVWTPAANRLLVGELVRGSADWQNYELTVQFRFGSEMTFGRDPQVQLLGYYGGHDQQYRVAIGPDGLALERRTPRSQGGAAVARWSADQPLAQPLVAGRLYTAKMRLENQSHGTWLAAKVWPTDAAEPAGWNVVHRDDSPAALKAGQIGLSACDAQVQFSRVEVELRK